MEERISSCIFSCFNITSSSSTDAGGKAVAEISGLRKR